MFGRSINSIVKNVEKINPSDYARTRNFTNGAVTRLSPYISRGVISTSFVLDSLLKRGFKSYQMEKIVQELAWRDYFQAVWNAKDVNNDLRQPQADVKNSLISTAIINAETGIEAVDDGINELYETGYIHNHLRMYISSVACNVGKSYWKLPAQWLYYHLLDADWASNACSWQWTAGAFSGKKYFANQENINRYCGTHQRKTFLDADYEDFEAMPIPEILRDTDKPVLKTDLPQRVKIDVDNSLPTFVYNFYNLDPFWKSDVKANRVLLLEPTHFQKYPVSSKTIDFVLKLTENIDGIKVFTGEFGELVSEYNLRETHYKQHPTNKHYKGIEHQRSPMFPEVQGYFPSFFGYWKKCEKLFKAKNN